MSLLHVGCWFGAAVLACALAGCGGGVEEGMPKDTAYVPAEMPTPSGVTTPEKKKKGR